MIAFIIIYVLVLISYLITETSGKMYLRAPNKIVLATMFLVFGIVQFELNYTITSLQLLFVIAMLFAWMGDVFLLFDFGRGGDFFLCGNVCFFVYEMAYLVENGFAFKDFWWFLPIAVALLTTFILLTNLLPNVFKLGKLKWPMTMYMATIILHGSIGIVVASLNVCTNMLVLGIGSALFMVSDFFIVMHKFVFPNNKWVLRLNSFTYFIGMLLIAMSLVNFA